MSEPIPSSKPEPTPFERMQELATRALSVPKIEVDRREREWREQRATARQEKKAQK